ncbi:hypothetical protein ACHAXS_004242 [Conticribra weissflogii]
MECPPGMTDDEEDDVLALNECIFGPLQVARQYHKKDVKFCAKLDLMGVVFDAIYVDDNLILGYPDAIKVSIEQFKNNGFLSKRRMV